MTTETYIPPEETQRMFATTIAVTYFLFSIAVVTTLLRIIIRRRTRAPYRLDDFLIFLAVLIHAGLVGMRHYDAIHRRANDLENPRLSDYDWSWDYPNVLITPRQAYLWEMITKMFLLQSTMYIAILGIVKLSILQFYHRFITNKAGRILNHCASAFILMLTIAIFFASLFQCTPVEAFWLLEPPEPWRCLPDEEPIYITHTVANTLTDIFVLMLPIRVVLQLQISTRKKWGLAGIFALGGIATIASIWRLVLLINTLDPDNTLLDGARQDWMIQIASHVEFSLGIVAANGPALGALIRAIRKREITFSSSSRGNTGHRHELRDYGKGGTVHASSAGEEQSSMDYIVLK